MKGTDFENGIRNDPQKRTQEEIGLAIGKSRYTIGRQYDKEEVPDWIVEACKKVGIVFRESDGKSEVPALKREIELLKDIIKSRDIIIQTKDDLIDSLRTQLNGPGKLSTNQTKEQKPGVKKHKT